MDMKQWVVMVGLVGILAGCQSVPQNTTGVLDNHTFMNLWHTYQRCASGTDIDQLQADVTTLEQASQLRKSHSEFTVPLPNAIMRHVSEQPSRVAADPQAMAAACSIHTAEVALEVGKNEVAAELLNGIVQRYPKSDYVYYVQQAQASLKRMQTGIDVARQSPAPSSGGSVLIEESFQ